MENVIIEFTALHVIYNFTWFSQESLYFLFWQNNRVVLSNFS